MQVNSTSVSTSSAEEKTISDLPGVFTGGIHCGIKKTSALDLGFIFIPQCVASAGVFTTNQFAAPSVIYTRTLIYKSQLLASPHPLKAVVVNSGNANACTGKQGLDNVIQVAEQSAQMLGISSSEIGIASTGIIGEQLPMEAINAGLSSLLCSPLASNGFDFSEAIMTTDKFPKRVYTSRAIESTSSDPKASLEASNEIIVAGTTKGCGMIAPNMATTLSFLVTNFAISSTELQSILDDVTRQTFNVTSVDTDTSTNDMILVFSTGTFKSSDNTSDNTSVNSPGNSPGSSVSPAHLETFRELLLEACNTLSLKLVEDGEGATKIVEVNVRGARSEQEAQAMATSIANSPLVKCAMYGCDPNWGRILVAAGKLPNVAIQPDKVWLTINGSAVVKSGCPLAFDRSALSESLKANRRVTIALDVGMADGSARAIGCDLTHDYVTLNSHYS